MSELKNLARRLLGHRLYVKLGRIANVRKPVAYYGARRIMEEQEGNQFIHSLVLSEAPCAIGKLGKSEFYAVNVSMEMAAQKKSKTKLPVPKQLHARSVLKELHINSGVFPPTYDNMAAFSDYFSMIVKDIDVLAASFTPGEGKFIQEFCPQAKLIQLRSIDPFYNQPPWTEALTGKSILVASPFIETIVSQYQRRSLIWPDQPAMLPEFDLQVLRLPLSDALVKSPYEDWFKAIEALQVEMRSRHFDVALIGGGAFSLPLAVTAKKMGKIGVHMGGSTQILFGIRGVRWDVHPEISAFYNGYWVRPSAQETPRGYRKVEGGAYW